MEDPNPTAKRVIAHFDLDAFYVCCERETNPSALLNVPVAVTQYNPLGCLEEVRPDEINKRLIVRPENTKCGDQNGSLIAVSYEARAKGVKRNMRVSEAVENCPTLRVVQVPVNHGKADLTIYRGASARVLAKLTEALQDCALTTTKTNDAAKKNMIVEKASIDEIYVDLTSIVDQYMSQRFSIHPRTMLSTENNVHWDEIVHTFGAGQTTIGGLDDSTTSQAADTLSKDELRRGSSLQLQNELGAGSKAWWKRPAGWTEDEVRLAIGAGIACKARATVAKAFSVDMTGNGNNKQESIYTLSAGIACNKTLAKLASGLRKPNSQTICLSDEVSLGKLFHPLPIGRIRGLGGKLGVKVGDALKIETVGELAKVPLADLESVVDGNTARFLYDISRGICCDLVSQRTTVKSIGCGKTFRGALAFCPKDRSTVQRWVKELSDELNERLIEDRDENKRIPKNFGVTIRYGGKHVSKSAPSMPTRQERYKEVAFQLVQEIVGQHNNVQSAIKGDSRPLIEGLTIFVGSFVDVASGKNSITAAFNRVTTSSQVSPKQPQLPSKASRSMGMSSAPKQPKNGNYFLKELIPKAVPVGVVNTKGKSAIDDSLTTTCEGDPKEETAVAPSASSDRLDSFIDQSVFQQLPVSIQNEIRMTQEYRGRGKSFVADKRKNRNELTGGSVSNWLKKSSEVTRQPTATRSDIGDSIDQDVLAELPADIRAEILSEQQQQRKLQRPKKKVRGIGAFFKTTK